MLKLLVTTWCNLVLFLLRSLVLLSIGSDVIRVCSSQVSCDAPPEPLPRVCVCWCLLHPCLKSVFLAVHRSRAVACSGTGTGVASTWPPLHTLSHACTYIVCQLAQWRGCMTKVLKKLRSVIIELCTCHKVPFPPQVGLFIIVPNLQIIHCIDTHQHQITFDMMIFIL